MMPDLPTITVTDAQAAKLLQVFGTVANYKAWLRQAIRTEVASRRYAALESAHQASIETEIWAAADEVLDP